MTRKFDNPHAHTIVVECRYWIGSSYQLAVLGTVSAGQSSCIFPGEFVANKGYYFRAYALSSYNRSSLSGQTIASCFFQAPTGLHVTGLSSSSVEFEWNDETSFETFFDLLQSINDSAYTPVGTYPANSTRGVLSIQGD